jgi:putative membrane-bound dehydrogenase-like protein
MLRRFPLFLFTISVLSSPLQAQPKKAGGPSDVVLPAEVQLKKFHLPEGFTVELIAAEPAVINPITMALDEKGRLYVTEGHTYRYGPKGSPVKNPTNPIVRLDPTADGKGWRRTIVAEGFDDPVMGLLVRDGKLWCTSCDHIYVYDIDDAGKTSNRREIVHDKAKAANPFGFFVLEWGPDDLIYVSVGNHGMDIAGATNAMKSRGNSGIIMRMKPDGSNLEKLVEGLRVPYAFEFDPFGQLWVLPNGQGNPDRFVKVIAGIDYHCYSRPKVSNAWLAGTHPLAPPCFETVNGARTQLLHYYGAAFPAAYQGRQFGVNWGPHGVGTRNHAIEEFVPDARERNTRTGNWLTSDDPRFRPTQLLLAPDGNLLVADWYGRDDENDLTGRIWKINYVGNDAPKVASLTDADWKDDSKVLDALGSPDHLERERAIRALVAKRDTKQLAAHAATSQNALGAAGALWALTRIGSTEAKALFAAGAKNPEWKVRRLALRLLKRFDVPQSDAVAKSLLQDSDPAVRLEAILLQHDSKAIHDGLMAFLRSDGAGDPHLRYEAAFHLARHARAETWSDLQRTERVETRLAGLIALDVALYEQYAAKELARQKLIEFMADPGQLDISLLLDLALLHPDNAMIPSIQKLLEQPKLTSTTIAQASRLLRALAGKDKSIKNPWLELLKSGKAGLTAPEDKQTVLLLLPDEGPSTFGIELLGKLIADGDIKGVVLSASALARSWEGKAASLADVVWKQLNNPKQSVEARIELAATLAAIEPAADVKRWSELLKSAEPALAREIVRDFRRLPKETAFRDALSSRAAELVKRDESIKHDLALSLSILGDAGERPELGPAIRGLKEYRDFAVKNFNAKPSPQQVALGRMAFERANCAKCHLLDANEKIGPTLGGVGRHELNHVIESILEPSRIILTGYEVERIETVAGVVHTGIVRDKGNELLIINAEKTERVPKSKVAERMLLKTSIMPDDIVKWISREEFADLLAFLMTQKANVGPPPKKNKK